MSFTLIALCGPRTMMNPFYFRLSASLKMLHYFAAGCYRRIKALKNFYNVGEDFLS